MKLQGEKGGVAEPPGSMPLKCERAIASIREYAAGLRLDWEHGEDWAQLYVGESMLVCMRRDTPLAFVIGGSPEALPVERALGNEGVVVIRAPSWEAEVLSLDPEVAPAAFPNWEWRGAPEDEESDRMSRMSLWDIWWFTI